ncbi:MULTISPECIES: energy-coupling factor ABC transporter ATP-binding protein [Pontibacillus]|uniref:Energy-coupling factor ABC transporter ATP-binding protein n=1 Tax=Pontibacillus chungwhensis TaxID=265426 RepID=A0ABY8UXR0_9BACI|nr:MULTISPECIES: energy-coupling factor ABC transporter ATP-binding protein [Pontibacillus]MCD5326011.1 energy-coupling factor ABC transporter ATP-binding protein [Pontibacillus sp. HN14]WIF98284.1 energy-coupling factor ABC transporter ATP-binding protein [Pontibacillus chungwhensis]
MEKSFLEFQNVSFQYREDSPMVLNDVSIQVNQNEWVAVIGHNGSGKSTMAKLMNGLLFPNAGEVHVDGLELSEENIWEIRRKVGMVFQNPDNQFVGTTVKDDVAFGLENHGIPREEMVKRIAQSLKAVGMEEYEDHEPHRLSGGQKQRVAIASVLAVAPSMIILDEATAMLDPKGRKEIMHTVNQVRQERDVSIVTITHDLNEVTLADRVVVMNDGDVWFEGTPRELFEHREDLQTIGLDIPLVSKFAHELHQLGLNISKQPLNHEELMDEIWTLHSTT